MQLVKFVGTVSRESIVDVEATVVKVAQLVTGCTQKTVELHVSSVFVVSMSEPNLPLQIEDAMRRSADDHSAEGDATSEEKQDGQQLARVKQDTKLGKNYLYTAAADLLTIATSNSFVVRLCFFFLLLKTVLAKLKKLLKNNVIYM